MKIHPRNEFRSSTQSSSQSSTQSFSLSSLGPCLVSLLWLGLLVFLLPAGAAAQSCDEVRFRLWQKDADATWFESDEPVRVASGESVHLYIHASGASHGRSSHYSTSARIAYPGNVGLEKSGVRAADVARHLKITPQTSDDRSAGRLRLEALAPGETALGYRIEGVKSPGRLEMIPPPCRLGTIAFHVTDGSDDDPGHDGDHDHGDDVDDHGAEESRAGAAETLAAELMSGFLRRDVDEADDGFVEEILRYGRDGILSVAGSVVASREFRTAALRRTDEAHEEKHEASLAELRQHLLQDIYRDLYGYAEPPRDEREADLRDLEICLEGSSDACERLGRELVSRRAFYEHHRELLDRL